MRVVDLDDARRKFVKADKAARAAIKKRALGDEDQWKKAVRERDKMSDLLRFFYYDDRPFWEEAKKAIDDVQALLVESEGLGRTARAKARGEEMERLKEEQRGPSHRWGSREAVLASHQREITAADILRGVKTRKS